MHVVPICSVTEGMLSPGCAGCIRQASCANGLASILDETLFPRTLKVSLDEARSASFLPHLVFFSSRQECHIMS